MSENNIKIVQLERFHDRTIKFSEYFSNFVEKVLEKYNSKKFKKRFWSKGQEPSQDLLWFLF